MLPEVTICRFKDDALFAYSMTYDEGTVDTLANALPVHEQFGIPGHVDVVAGQLGQQRNAFGSSLNDYVHMGVDELKFLVSKGWGVGNHSWSHYHYPCSPGLDLFREVVWSKYRLEDMLGQSVQIFTIPNNNYNWEPVINLVEQHYLACATIDGGLNRDGFDLYKIGNYVLGSSGNRPRPGWPEQLKTENLTLDYLRDAWLYETSHLCMWDVPQSHKCVTPEYMTDRFEKLREISAGRMWAAKPEDVINYELLRRHLTIENVRLEEADLCFEVGGSWPVGVINSGLSLHVSGWQCDRPPMVEQEMHALNGGYALYDKIVEVRKHADGWLIDMQLAPYRTVRLRHQD